MDQSGWGEELPKVAAHLMMFARDESSEGMRQAIRDIHGQGLDGIEIPLTLGLIDRSPHIADEARELGLDVIASTVLPHGFDIGADNAEERQRGISFLMNVIDVAARINTTILGGIIHQPPRLIPTNVRSERRRTWTIQGLNAAANHASAAGVRLAVEPTSRFFTSEINTVAEALQVLRSIDAPLGIVLDTYQLASEEADILTSVSEGLYAAAYI